MVTELQQFKDDYDNNRPLWRVMPEFLNHCSGKYEKIGLLATCAIRSTASTRRTTWRAHHREVPLGRWTAAMRPAECVGPSCSSRDRPHRDPISSRGAHERCGWLARRIPRHTAAHAPGERFNKTIRRALSAICASVQSAVPGLRDGYPWPRLGEERHGAALLCGLRNRHLIRHSFALLTAIQPPRTPLRHVGRVGDSANVSGGGTTVSGVAAASC